MKILSVSDPEFKDYGTVLDFDASAIVNYLENKAKMPEEKNLYVRDDIAMHSLKGIQEIKESIFGLGEIEVGYCNGFNSLLNCMEYHACPEVDIAADDLVLLLGTQQDVVSGVFDSSKAKAFLLKRGETVCLNPYTLHFSPCKLSPKGFRSAIILSDKTNMDLEELKRDAKLWKVNKWLLAHKDTVQAQNGAYIGIAGENIKIDF